MLRISSGHLSEKLVKQKLGTFLWEEEHDDDQWHLQQGEPEKQKILLYCYSPQTHAHALTSRDVLEQWGVDPERGGGV